MSEPVSETEIKSEWFEEGGKKYHLPTIQSCVNVMYSHGFEEMDLEESRDWFEGFLENANYKEND